MKLKTKKKISKKTILIALGIIIIIVLSLGIYLYAFKGTLFGWTPLASDTSDSGSINYDQPTGEQKKAGSDTKENATSTPQDSDKPISGSDQPPAPTPQPNGKSQVQVTFTAPAGSTTPPSFQVRVLISTVTNSGTCTLTFTKAGHETVTKTAGVQPMANSSTCQGFDVTLNSGVWQMALKFENEKLIGNNNQTITVQ